MIIYVDMNTDVTDEKFIETEGQIRKRNWISYKSTQWTRKGVKNQKNINIDIILTRNIPKELFKVKWGEWNRILSDHVPIFITISKYIKQRFN